MSVTDAHPELCMSPAPRAKLTITLGQDHYVQSFSGFTPCDGMTVVVGSAGSAPPSFELDDTNGLTVNASALAGTLPGFTGQLMLSPGGTSVLGSDTLLSLRAAGTARLAATFDVKPGSQSLVVTTDAAASVMTADGQLVPSEWDRETIVFGPLLGGLVTALVVAPLGVSLGVLTDALKRWPGPQRHGPEEGATP